MKTMSSFICLWIFNQGEKMCLDWSEQIYWKNKTYHWHLKSHLATVLCHQFQTQPTSALPDIVPSAVE